MNLELERPETPVSPPVEPISYAFFAGPPPVKDGGHASLSIAWSWSQAMRQHTALLITRRFHRSIDPEKIKATVGVPTLICPDFSRLGLRRFSEMGRCLLDTALLCLVLPWVGRAIRRSGAKRIFAFPHGWWVSLVDAYLLGLASGLPVDVYFVDDLAELALMQKKTLRARISTAVERILLPRFARIYVISKGYAEHLKAKYGVAAKWLPLVIRMEQPVVYAAPPKPGETRYIGFSGSISGLYRDALRELHAAVVHLNRTSPFRYKIALCILGLPADFSATFPDASVVEVFANLPNDQLVARLSANYANFLPYTFDEELKTMVSTAFSCKTSEYFAAGRPILVYGPSYASVPRHFLENHLPLVSTVPGGVETLISEVEQFDQPALIAKYREVIEEYHSPEALRHRLVSPAAEEGKA
jgi:hypothetical protein